MILTIFTWRPYCSYVIPGCDDSANWSSCEYGQLCHCLKTKERDVSWLTYLGVVSPLNADLCIFLHPAPSHLDLWLVPLWRAQKMVLQRLGGGRDLVSPDLC